MRIKDTDNVFIGYVLATLIKIRIQNPWAVLTILLPIKLFNPDASFWSSSNSIDRHEHHNYWTIDVINNVNRQYLGLFMFPV